MPQNRFQSYVGKFVAVYTRGNTILNGLLLTFDGHTNLVLRSATETKYVVKRGADGTKTNEPVKRQVGLVLIRGDTVISVEEQK